MCRGKNECSELGSNPELWDKFCPLKPPEWLESQIDLFANAVEAFRKGNRNKCIEIISATRGPDIQEWFIEHGQTSGNRRTRILRIPKPESVSDHLRDSNRNPTKHQKEVFERDGFRCRYCGIRLISQVFMKAFIKKLDWHGFRKGSKNLERHGMIFATWPYADHVIPWNLGGSTDTENLVSSCGSCNFGKGRYTIEQMGIENPFDRPPNKDTWDGLTSKTLK
jgi:5-methylcytosine-specific restriction endonuclease McrA